MLFEVHSRHDAATTVVSVVGDVDVATLPRFAAEIATLEGDTTIDLTGVDWFDPICLGVLVASALKVRRAGHEIRVVASQTVGDLLEESRLNEVILVEIPGGLSGA